MEFRQKLKQGPSTETYINNPMHRSETQRRDPNVRPKGEIRRRRDQQRKGPAKERPGEGKTQRRDSKERLEAETHSRDPKQRLEEG